MLKKFINNSVYRNDIVQFINYIIGYVMVLILGYGVNVLINKKLSPLELGLYSYIQGLINILAPILCLAFYNAYLRFHHDHTLSRSMLRYGIPFYIFSATVCAVIICIITRSFIPVLYAFFVFFIEKQYILRVQMQIWKLNLLRCMELLIPLLFLGWAFFSDIEVKAEWVLFFYGLGFCTSFLFSSKSKLNDESVAGKNLFKYLFPVIGTSFITFMLLNIGVIFARHYFGLSSAAEWGVAARATAIYKSFTSLFLIFFPMIYFREAGKNNYKIITVYRGAITLLAVFMAIPFVLFPSTVYMLLGARAYEATCMLLVFLCCGELCNFLSSLWGLFFDYEIKTWKITTFKGVELILFLGGVLIFGHKSLMMIGMAYLIATILSFLGMFCCGMIQEKRHFNKTQNKGFL